MFKIHRVENLVPAFELRNYARRFQRTWTAEFECPLRFKQHLWCPPPTGTLINRDETGSVVGPEYF